MSTYLLRIKELFDKNGFGLIEHISLPFIFGFIDKDSIQIVLYGLGFEQGFIYEDEDYWICTNKCWPIIKFTGKKFRVDDDGWKHYLKIGYFPLAHTPFTEILFLGRGDIWRFNKGEGLKLSI